MGSIQHNLPTNKHGLGVDINKRLSNYILNQAGRMLAIGLYYGKMGAVLALSKYASSSNNQILSETLQYLLNGIYESLNEYMPLGMENGLAGIGYALTILSSTEDLNTDINDILYELDQCIMYTDPTRFPDLSFRTGLLGVWAYLCEREKKGSLSSFDGEYIQELKTTLSVKGQLHRRLSLFDNLDKPTFDISEYENKPVSLSGGSSYYLLQNNYD